MPQDLTNAFLIMGKGMGGIFVVMIVLLIVVSLLVVKKAK